MKIFMFVLFGPQHFVECVHLIDIRSADTELYINLVKKCHKRNYNCIKC